MAIYTVSKDSQGQWRWAFHAKNSRIIAVSSEGYHNRSDCLAALKLLKREGPTAPAYDTTASPPQAVPGI